MAEIIEHPTRWPKPELLQEISIGELNWKQEFVVRPMTVGRIAAIAQNTIHPLMQLECLPKGKKELVRGDLEHDAITEGTLVDLLTKEGTKGKVLTAFLPSLLTGGKKYAYEVRVLEYAGMIVITVVVGHPPVVLSLEKD